MQLVFALGDGSPAVRLFAYEALRRATGQDFFANWLRGPEDERKQAREKYAAWITKKR